MASLPPGRLQSSFWNDGTLSQHLPQPPCPSRSSSLKVCSHCFLSMNLRCTLQVVVLLAC